MITDNIINKRLEMKDRRVYKSKSLSKGHMNSDLLDGLFYASDSVICTANA